MEVIYLTLSQFGSDSSSCDSFQIKLVNAHAQSVPLLVHDLRKPLLLRNSMRMESLVVALSYPVMRKHLLNASDILLMSHAAKPSIAMQKTKPSQYLFPAVGAMTSHRTRLAMILKLGTKRYVIFLS